MCRACMGMGACALGFMDRCLAAACGCVPAAMPVCACLPACLTPAPTRPQVRAVGPWPFPLSHRVHRCIEALIADLDGITVVDLSVCCPHTTCPGATTVRYATRIAANLRRGALLPCPACDGGFAVAGFVASWGSAGAAVAPDALAADVDGAIAHAHGLGAGPAREEARSHASRALSRWVQVVAWGAAGVHVQVHVCDCLAYSASGVPGCHPHCV